MIKQLGEQSLKRHSDGLNNQQISIKRQRDPSQAIATMHSSGRNGPTWVQMNRLNVEKQDG